MTILTASASSPLVAGLLENAARSAQPEAAAAAARVQTLDVVPADSDDPRGSVLSSLVLPLVLSGVIRDVACVRTIGPRVIVLTVRVVHAVLNYALHGRRLCDDQ